MNITAILKNLCIFISLPGFIILSVYMYKNNRNLKEQRSQFNQIINGMPVGVVKVDEDGKVLFENQKSYVIAGCSFQDLKGLEHRQLLKNFSEREQSLDLRGNLQDIESVPFRKGIIKQVFNKAGVSLKLVIDIIKYDGGYLYLFEDAQKRLELENLQVQTQTILNSITNILLVIDKHGKVILGNRALSYCLEMDLKEIIGMDIKDLIEIIRLSPQEALMTDSQRDDGDPEEVSITSIKGNSKSILLYQSPIRNELGEVIGFICVGTDFTSIKEEQYKIMQNEKLVTLGQMAAGIVHEIRNPLTAIKGFSQIIQKLAEDKKVLECARLIDNETNNMNKVVTDFLKFARPSPPVLKEVKVRDLLESMKLIIESNAFIRKINVHFQYNKADIAVFADDDQLRQVILNLAQNAMDAMTNTTDPLLNIVSGYNRSTHQVYIAVSDNGKGMTYDERVRAGTPFFTTKDRGTGLGLSVCFQIVREHGGHMKIDSTPGEGTTVSIFLDPAFHKKGITSIA